jgi:hypothetical protein
MMITIILALLFSASVGACLGFFIASCLLMGKISDLERELESERLSGGSR